MKSGLFCVDVIGVMSSIGSGSDGMLLSVFSGDDDDSLSSAGGG